MAARFEGDAWVVHGGAARHVRLVAAVVPVLVLATTLGESAAAVAILTGGLAMFLAFAFAAGHHRRPSGAKSHVAADARGLDVGGALRVPRAAIARARVAAIDNAHAVHLERGFLRESTAVVFEDEDEALALLEALQLDSSAAVTRFRALPPWAKHLRGLAVFATTAPWLFVNIARFLPLWAWAVIAAAYALIGLPALLPQRVDVGHDGIFLRWLGNRRFVPYRSIEEVRPTSLGVALDLRDGRTMEIRLAHKPEAAQGERARLLSSLRAAREVFERGSAAEDESLLARGTRDLDTWVRDMRSLAVGEPGGYRVLAVPRERLWSVLENPAAEPSAREGAALALHGTLDEEERLRLASLAHTTALPRLRVALDGIARETDEKRLRIALDLADREEEPEPPSLRTARVARRE